MCTKDVCAIKFIQEELALTYLHIKQCAQCACNAYCDYLTCFADEKSYQEQRVISVQGFF